MNKPKCFLCGRRKPLRDRATCQKCYVPSAPLFECPAAKTKRLAQQNRRRIAKTWYPAATHHWVQAGDLTPSER